MKLSVITSCQFSEYHYISMLDSPLSGSVQGEGDFTLVFKYCVEAFQDS